MPNHIFDSANCRYCGQTQEIIGRGEDGKLKQPCPDRLEESSPPPLGKSSVYNINRISLVFLWKFVYILSGFSFIFIFFSCLFILNKLQYLFFIGTTAGGDSGLHEILEQLIILNSNNHETSLVVKKINDDVEKTVKDIDDKKKVCYLFNFFLFFSYQLFFCQNSHWRMVCLQCREFHC